MRRYSLIMAIVQALGLNLLFLYYFWIYAEYERDVMRASWHLRLISGIMVAVDALMGVWLCISGGTPTLSLYSRPIAVSSSVIGIAALLIMVIYALPLVMRTPDQNPHSDA